MVKSRLFHHLFLVIVTYMMIWEQINYGVFMVEGEISYKTMERISNMNKKGPYVGIVVPNAFEMNPLLESAFFVADPHFPYLDFSGRRFRFGEVKNTKVIIVMTGLGMLNAGIATELLVSLFDIKGVVHYGIAGNANPELQIGDVTIPQYWAHTGLWNWQKFGDGPEDELALESSGDYTRKLGYLKFSQYNDDIETTNAKKPLKMMNLLNNVWYQPEEVFPVNGIPEVRQHVFWVPVDQFYFKLTAKLKDIKLNDCVNNTCLPRKPKVVRLKNGVTANIFVDNAAYRQFLHTKFNATPIDMESASVALICYQHKAPFIAIRALSDLAGGGSSISNEASIFGSLAAENSVTVLVNFFSILSKNPSQFTSHNHFHDIINIALYQWRILLRKLGSLILRSE